VRLAPERNPFPRLLVFPFGLAAAAGLGAARLRPDDVLRAAHCRLRDLTGLPCPTCGATQAAVHLAHGRWSEAWLASPPAAVAGALFVLWVIWGLATTLRPRWRRNVELTGREKTVVRIAAGGAILAGWAYQFLRRG
jgi:hypothetical protein